MDGREQLRQRSHRHFVRWGIQLPVDAMSPGVVWLITQWGWTIWTRFDIGSEDGRERLDYYAMHRMTSDRHVRLHADGDEEELLAMRDGYVTSPGATVAEQEAGRDEYFAHNQAVEKLLEEKGFVMTDQTHVSARINRILQTDPDAEDLRGAGHDIGPGRRAGAVDLPRHHADVHGAGGALAARVVGGLAATRRNRAKAGSAAVARSVRTGSTRLTTRPSPSRSTKSAGTVRGWLWYSDDWRTLIGS